MKRYRTSALPYDGPIELQCAQNARSVLAMKRSGAFLLALGLAANMAVADDKSEAGKLAREVWKKCGGEEWIDVQEVRFTFVEEQRGKKLFTAEHIWNVAGATDDVKWEGRHVKVNLADPGGGADAKAAYNRWANDSNWLVAPLKLCDPGADLHQEGVKEIDGHKFRRLRMHCKDAGQRRREYVLYIDQRVGLVRYWEYPSKDGTSSTLSTWEKYLPFSGITLSTEHKVGAKRILLTNVQVSMSR